LVFGEKLERELNEWTNLVQRVRTRHDYSNLFPMMTIHRLVTHLREWSLDWFSSGAANYPPQIASLLLALLIATSLTCPLRSRWLIVGGMHSRSTKMC